VKKDITAIYESDKNIKAVIHIHDLELWNLLKKKYPITNKNSKFGTPEIANDIIKFFSDNKLGTNSIIVLGGHKPGIMIFGESLKEAYDLLSKSKN
jgi:L-ribulose-5-phosphate 4-epimerase